MTTPPTGQAEDFSEFSRPSDSRHAPDALGRGLQTWLAAQLGGVGDVSVTDVRVPDANGMSSETVLFDAEWTEDGVRSRHRLVARIAPGDSAVPIFPHYDLDQQFRIMRTVGESSPVPVPRVYWSEPSPAPLGDPFFIMEQVHGDVPPDVLPYNFGSWLTEATPAQRARLQSQSIQVLADLHAIEDPAAKFPQLSASDDASTAASALRAHVASQRAYYEWVTATGPKSALIERGFDWLEAHWPEESGPAVFCWGDARIGNILYRDFTPVGVLDWEMATLGTRELDLSWTIFLHRFFEDLTTLAGLPGLPDFLRREEVAAQYEQRTGHTPRNLDFYTLYAAVRHAIIMFRIQCRAIAFGQSDAPADPDDMILHRATLEKMLDGVYWSELAERQVG
ncbi:phosphotransferase family protein [Tomitella biformata]|uniref:phosphotransferase family protein n=1 Tax=Tomitella biformata TaxID=630403 RepID=UPI000466C29F|nr:phosphotransferase family protein [Tomitella biformata]